MEALAMLTSMFSILKEGISIVRNIRENQINIFVKTTQILIGGESFLAFFVVCNNAAKPITITRMAIKMHNDIPINRIPLTKLEPLDGAGMIIMAHSHKFADRFMADELWDLSILPNNLYMQENQAFTGWALFKPQGRIATPSIAKLDLELETGSGDVITQSIN